MFRIAIAICLFIFSFPIQAKNKKVAETTSSTHFNINNISTWIYNNGNSDITPDGQSGLLFPACSNKTASFETGLIWGATINGEKRVGGSTYNQGLLPGSIIGSGEDAVRENDSLKHVRIYRVRRDYSDPNADFSRELYDNEGTVEEIITQYEKDWIEWPAEFGAPFEDVDNNGSYNSTIDIPGVIGANQTIWYVANDFDSTTCLSLYGSLPMGIEMQATFWGYKTNDALSNVMFRKYILINKSKYNFDSMYFNMWADFDLGDASDDFCGCDTTLSLMYTYNGKMEDAIYGTNVPAIGYNLLQGPIIPSLGDTAIVDNEYKLNYKNLPMTSHHFFIGGDPVYTDPSLGLYKGRLQFHNLFRGLIPNSGKPFVDPVSKSVTKFMLSGNPVTGTGWIDGILHQPGDRRQGLVSGPFNMKPGDVQEIIFSELASFGGNNIGAITKLKETSKKTEEIYNSFFKIKKNPSPPFVVASITGNEIPTLSWKQNSQIESFNEEGFKFQGYNLYQISDQWENKLIKTFDIIDGITTITQIVYDPYLGIDTLKDVAFGTDSGLEYEFKIEENYLSDENLLVGKNYYYAVSSYAYNSNTTEIKFTESPIIKVEHMYNACSEGFRFGDEIETEHSVGKSNSYIEVTVYDKTKITGLKYNVTFFSDTAKTSPTFNKILWKLTDENNRVAIDSCLQLPLNSNAEGIIVDGLIIKVFGELAGIKDWNYTGHIWVSGNSNPNPLRFFFRGMDNGHNFLGSTINILTDYKDVQLVWAGASDRSDLTAEGLARASMIENPSLWSKAALYNKHEEYAFGGIADIPFAVYDIESDPQRRLNIVMIEDADSGSANKLWDMGWNGSEFAEQGGYEYIFIMASNYNEGANYNNINWGPASDVLYAIRPQGRSSREYLQSEFELDINKTNSSFDDVFTFDTKQPETSFCPKEYSISQNYPNPFNPTTKINFVVKEEGVVKIKIYDILGREITTLINKEYAIGKHSVNFNGTNLTSGVYFYRIEINSFSDTKKMLLLR